MFLRVKRAPEGWLLCLTFTVLHCTAAVCCGRIIDFCHSYGFSKKKEPWKEEGI